MLFPSKIMLVGILSPSKMFTKHGDKMIFKVTMLSSSKIDVNRDLVPIRNIYYSWGQDEFKLYIMSPLKKHHKRDLVPIRKDNFQSFYLVPIEKNRVMRILSPSEIFTKHGDKMIFKVFILSPSTKHVNRDLVPIRNIY